jgi:hypothetical protein
VIKSYSIWYMEKLKNMSKIVKFVFVMIILLLLFLVALSINHSNLFYLPYKFCSLFHTQYFIPLLVTLIPLSLFTLQWKLYVFVIRIVIKPIGAYILIEWGVVKLVYVVKYQAPKIINGVDLREYTNTLLKYSLSFYVGTQ